MKVLVLRYAAIGDCVMSAWSVTALKQAMPDAEIHWGIQPRCAEIVDSRRLAQPRVVPRDKRAGVKSWRGLLKYWLDLRKEKFDLGLDFQGHSKTALALRFAAPKKRLAGRATDALSRRLNPLMEPPKELTHFIEREHWLVQQVVECALPERPLMPELESERAQWRAMGKYISIQTGAGSLDKQYPPHYWQAVANVLSDQQVKIVGLGAKGDHPLMRVMNMVGKLSFTETMACVAESQVHVAADTGTGHVAAAYATPLVSVFGPTNPAKCRPWGEKCVLLKEGKSTADVSPTQAAQAVLAVLRGDA